MSTQLTWLTDIHLNFLESEALEKFVDRLSKRATDGVIIAGDIGEADSIQHYLKILSKRVQCPIYFVLGNHDYYGASTDYVRSQIRALVLMRPNLHWLNDSNVISLSPSTALIGHDGWADARLGDYWHSTVQLNDFRLIGDFLGTTTQERLDRMKALGDEAAAHFQKTLPAALDNHHKVIIVTHVPPFAESARHKGRICAPDWLPFFSCKAVGDVLRSIMTSYPDKEALVLCGHTHGRAEYQASPNLKVVTGGAVYGKPAIHRSLVVE